MTISFRFFIILLLIYVVAGFALAAREMEALDRGAVAVSKGGSEVYIGWRMLGVDPSDVAFNVYRNSTKINSSPITSSTNYTDHSGSVSYSYSVAAVIGGVEQDKSDAVSVWGEHYLAVPLQTPAGYHPDDASVGDLDGDGQYEIVLKQEQTPYMPGQSGACGQCKLEGYELDGTLLWRIDLGINIREGDHYTQFMVYDFDGDGKAEIACKTADGTVDGLGTVIGNPTVDYRNADGKILSGPEFFTVFDGETGGALQTVDYIPSRGNISDWGDNYGNRVDRFLACVAYLDGVRPSIVMCRGYYTRTVLAAWDFREGQLTSRWVFDSDDPGNGGYAGQGNHNLSVGDVDGDGKDEIVYGGCVIDNDGTGLYTTGQGHGDAMHFSDMDPTRPGLEVWRCLEKDPVTGACLTDAGTGEVIFEYTNATDVGRACAGDIDPRYPGYEMWGSTGCPLYTCKGVEISASKPVVNFMVWWDGDLLREVLNDTSIYKWNHLSGSTSILLDAENYGCDSNNGTKAVPCLQADILGDWREEVIWRTTDSQSLLIFTTTIPTNYRLYTFMHDPVYRLGIAWQNVAYNQPPHVGYYMGDGMSGQPAADIEIVNGNPLSISITSPANNAGFEDGDDITITADASDADGTVTGVEFYQGTVKIGEDHTAPYSIRWEDVQDGSYVLTAIATDNDGLSRGSAPINIRVKAPGIAIEENTTGFCGVDGTVDNNNPGFTGTGFANTFNAVGNGIDWKIYFPSSGQYTFTFRYANGSSGRPAALKVDGFAVSTVTFGSTGGWDTWDTVSMTVSLPSGLKDVRLEATGTGGLANIDRIEISGSGVLAAKCSGNNPPVVSLISPQNGDEFTEGDDVVICAEAFDMDGIVSKVEFYNGDMKLGEETSESYEYYLSSPARGSYSISAAAIDNESESSESSVSISVWAFGDFTRDLLVNDDDLKYLITSHRQSRWYEEGP